MEESPSGAGSYKRTRPVEAARRRGRTDAPTAPWKTLRVFPELPQGLAPSQAHPTKNPEKHRSLGLLEPLQPIPDPHEL